ncbi:MAG: YraN family protein [Gammaproteobacteria bacterium]|nr:YraN family protein [Gammaproteobacteria bacterium]MCH9716431.1 YraN family protein [Gammaproteobacteria bacterium]MCH9764245.1 YraN family protein [Gammaproteobacteria bacterium]
MTAQKTRAETGRQAEAYAKKYLEKQGLIWLASNYYTRAGEIDLIMHTPSDELVFVEVRRRASSQFGGAAASVTRVKQMKLIKAASYYLMTHAHQGNQGVRFDVLALDGNPPRVTWIKQAFEE